MRILLTFLLLPYLALSLPLHARTPANIPSASSARSMLKTLKSRTTDAPGYKRALFPHWSTVSGTCE